MRGPGFTREGHGLFDGRAKALQTVWGPRGFCSLADALFEHLNQQV